MNERDHILALRSIAGELSAEESAEFSRRREKDPALDRACRELEGTTRLLAGTGHESFGVSFADRLMERLDDRGSVAADGDFAAMMTRLFARLAPIGVAAAVILGGYNLVTAEEGLTPLEATIGLEPVDIAESYSMMLDEVTYESLGTTDQLVETE